MLFNYTIAEHARIKETAQKCIRNMCERLDGIELSESDLLLEDPPPSKRTARMALEEALTEVEATHARIILERADKYLDLTKEDLLAQTTRAAEREAQRIAKSIEEHRTIVVDLLSVIVEGLPERYHYLPRLLAYKKEATFPAPAISLDTHKKEAIERHLWPCSVGVIYLTRLMADYVTAWGLIDPDTADTATTDIMRRALMVTRVFFDDFAEFGATERLERLRRIILSVDHCSFELRHNATGQTSYIKELKTNNKITLFCTVPPQDEQGRGQIIDDYDILLLDVLYTRYRMGHTTLNYTTVLSDVRQQNNNTHWGATIEDLHNRLKKLRLTEVTVLDSPEVLRMIKKRGHAEWAERATVEKTLRGVTLKGQVRYLIAANLAFQVNETARPSGWIELLEEPFACSCAAVRGHVRQIAANSLTSKGALNTSFTVGAKRYLVDHCLRRASPSADKSKAFKTVLLFSKVYQIEELKLKRAGVAKKTIANDKSQKRRQFEKLMDGLEWLTYERFYKPVKGKQGRGEAAYKIVYSYEKLIGSGDASADADTMTGKNPPETT